MRLGSRTTARCLVFAVVSALQLLLCHAMAEPTGEEDSHGSVPPRSRTVENLLMTRLGPLVRDATLPGFVFVIAEGDRITVSRGIGYADIARQVPLDPESTMMRVGSITKSFTAIAIHQLVAEGKIDLDKDANLYLSSERIPDTYKAPVTVRDLLVHRAGFDGNISGASVVSNKDVPIEQGWMSRQFIRLLPSGDIVAYDNTAYAALGQILVDQTGKSYHQVLRERIFEPLGMNDTTVGIPPAREAQLATCYNRASGDLRRCQHELLRETYQAAGGLSTTAHDMGKFLLALLHEGEWRGTRILSDKQFNRFREPALRLQPGSAGVGMGSYETGPPGHGVFGHSGGIRGGSALYTVMPRDNIAVFLAINASVSDGFKTTLSDLISMALASSTPDNLDPGDLATFELPARIPALFYSIKEHTGDFTPCPYEDIEGRYQYIRAQMFSSLVMRLLGPIAMTPIEVRSIPGGTWQINGKGPYHEIDTCLFRLKDGSYASGDTETLVAFSRTDNGVLIGGGHPLAAWIKLPWHASPLVSLYPYFLSIVVLILLWPLAIVTRGNASRCFLYGSLGATLLLTGLLLEMEYQTPVYQYGGNVLPMLLWRIVLHAGLVLVIVALVKAIIELYQNNAWATRSAVFPGLLLLGGTTVVGLSIYWGIAGRFAS